MIEIFCQAILFDLDGVLMNSNEAATRVWRRWAVAHKFDPDEVVHRSHGRPSIATIRDFLPDSDHERENQLVEHAEMRDLEGVKSLPGARSLLAKLPASRWAIVTSSTKPLAVLRLEATGLPLPECFITSSELMMGKPHPEPYLRASAKLSYSPADCIVVEDSPAGVKAGKSAGCKVVGLRTSASEENLKMAGADWIVSNCSMIDVELITDRLRVLLTP